MVSVFQILRQNWKKRVWQLGTVKRVKSLFLVASGVLREEIC